MNKTKIAVDIFDKLATVYQDKFMDVSLYGDSFDFFLNSIGCVPAKVLELACGPGNITKYLLHKRPDLNILGTDLSPNMLRLAKVNNPTAQFQLMDCKALGYVKEKYDGILCGFCLPYLSKQEAIKLIADAAEVLNQKGLIYLSTMEDEYSKSGFEKGTSGEEMFMHYHEADYLTEALIENNFGIVYLDRKNYVQGQKKVTDLLIIAQKSV